MFQKLLRPHPLRVDNIAVLFIDGSIEFNRFVQSIKLPKRNSYPSINAIATLSGWEEYVPV